jgi:V/A-type H+-transporting ATPase subunit D
MPLRIPPGRAGRTWIAARLETARRGADLLDRKRQALLREQARVWTEADASRRAWHDALAQAEQWTARATMLDGSGRLELLTRHVTTRATAELAWSSLMGAQLPSLREVAIPTPPALSALGASAAAVFAAQAWCQATRDATRHAVALRADAELSAELGRATRRLRALQKRWIPQHEAALAQLDLTLDETQREQAARVRWLTRQPDASSATRAQPGERSRGSGDRRG